MLGIQFHLAFEASHNGELYHWCNEPIVAVQWGFDHIISGQHLFGVLFYISHTCLHGDMHWERQPAMANENHHNHDEFGNALEFDGARRIPKRVLGASAASASTPTQPKALYYQETCKTSTGGP